MILYVSAQEILMAAARPLGDERVPLSQSLERILAEDVVCDADSPPFRKSAMDGYACRREDLGKDLTVVEEIPAGHVPVRGIGPGECAKIMTGAPVPEGADVVVMVEFAKKTGEGRIRFTGKATTANICEKGEDVKAGDVVLTRGESITPARIAVLASVGCVNPLVARQPCVGVIATGDELVDPAEKPGSSAIRNSNSIQLCAQAQAMRVPTRDYGIAGDSPEVIASAVERAKRECDIVLLSGGVSAGDYDFVPDVLRKLGFDLKFDSVAMQPGRPTVFGTDGHVYAFGLPGNPVSTYVIFEMLLKPFIHRLMGHEHRVRWIAAVLDRDVRRRKTVRQSSLPVVFTAPGRVAPLEYHGSAHIHAMSRAEALLTIPVGVTELKKGAEVHVRPL